MECRHAYYLALLQGVTEFLPVSGAGHRLLAEAWLGWLDLGLAYNAALQLGGLIAIGTYYPSGRYVAAGPVSAAAGRRGEVARLGGMLLLATLPSMGIMLGLHGSLAAVPWSPLVVGVTSVLFALLLGVADRCGMKRLDQLVQLSWRSAAMIGMLQMVAFVPGVSRVGLCLTGGLLLGLQRKPAVEFAVLLMAPLSVLTAAMNLWEWAHSSQPVNWYAVIIGTITAAVAGYLAIDLLMRVVPSRGTWPFVLYRLALGGALLVWFRTDLVRVVLSVA